MCMYVFLIFNIFDIYRITFKENENDISDIFDISHTLYKNVCVYVLFPSSASLTYIALQPLGVFDLSLTSST